MLVYNFVSLCILIAFQLDLFISIKYGISSMIMFSQSYKLITASWVFILLFLERFC